MKQHCVSFQNCMMYLIDCRPWCVLYMYLCVHSTYCWCVCMNVIDQCISVVCSVCCSSLLLQELKPVLCIVRPAAVASIDSLTVICEKHQVLPRKKQTNKKINNKKQRRSCGQAAQAWKQECRGQKTKQTFEMFSPDNKFWWWWCTSSGLFVSATPFWDALYRTGWDGSAPRRASHGAWWWYMSSRKTKQYFYSVVSIVCLLQYS